ncbi:hypothetical protein GGQ73_002506 [Rhizobium skierniewicense]|uniref:DUF2628 domain-containing protein n=1 Tax=Rhizobium skierniewicense TaxID=984260 RepID=A0A7W6C6B3_9HYPH|nr:DUF2628 domain-containing protein [Rhizobium skierniewicense]MBB3946553.1 hypothetical protein [Rhizobium skierniewicense]
MTSYLVLEAPGGPDRDHRSTRFIADRFSWLALLFPWVWFAIQRLWWLSIGIIILQVAASQMSRIEDLGIANALFALMVGLIAGFEGRNMVVRHLVSRGWILKTVIHARDLATAEEIYFSNLPAEDFSQTSNIPHPDWKRDRKTGNGFMSNDPAGSFQFDLNGRR